MLIKSDTSVIRLALGGDMNNSWKLESSEHPLGKVEAKTNTLHIQ